MRPFTFPRQLPSISFTPIRYRPNGLGFWSGHIPFACDLIATLRPATLVELGTQMGESYFAFCQSIVEHQVSCQSFAVDTWRGDRHTRPYDNVVFLEVDAINRERYAHFSTLLRETFDQAAPRFADESIDLLHIDGAHTYEAVSHDFLNWWPKVKPGGVVIMHDSFERQWEFGVWRLLEELRSTGLPAAEFVHSHGLAVIVKPPVIGDEHVAASFVTASETAQQEIRHYYETCAGNLQARFLRDKQSRPSEWELITQLFWRVAGDDFNEMQSVQLAHVVGASPQTAILHIPPSPVPYEGFRLALSLTPAMLRVFSIVVTDASGQVLWTREDHAGLLCAGEPGELYFDLQLPGSVHQQGAQMSLLLSGLDPFAAARQLAAQTA